MDVDPPYLYKFQFIIVGTSEVGKSCLLRRFVQGKYDEMMTSTCGVDFYTKMIQIDGHNLKLQLWDTAGQERFKAIARAYYRNAVGVLVVFDISNHDSYTEVPQYIADIKEFSRLNSPYFLLVGNKSDNSESGRQVLTTQVQEFASVHKVEYIETSAKSGKNIEQPFKMLARTVYEAIQDGSIEIDETWQGIRKGTECPKELHPYGGTLRLSRRISETKRKAGCC